MSAVVAATEESLEPAAGVAAAGRGAGHAPPPARAAACACRVAPCEPRPGIYVNLIRGHVVVLIDSSWPLSRDQIWEWLGAAHARALRFAPEPSTPVLVLPARDARAPATRAHVAANVDAVVAWVRRMRRPAAPAAPGAAPAPAAPQRRVRMCPPLKYTVPEQDPGDSSGDSKAGGGGGDASGDADGEDPNNANAAAAAAGCACGGTGAGGCTPFRGLRLEPEDCSHWGAASRLARDVAVKLAV